MSTPDSTPPQFPPVPAYGEYAPQAHTPVGAQPPAYAPQYTQQPYYATRYGAKPPLRTADMIVSILLLAAGLIGTLIALAFAGGLDAFMQGGYDSGDLGTYVPTGAQTVAQTVLVATHLLLFAVTATLTILLIVKRKISFWLPLSAGILAAIVFWVTLGVLMYSDPTIGQYLLDQAGY